jgi:formylglycine-generating enzyme required for sulfatase activity
MDWFDEYKGSPQTNPKVTNTVSGKGFGRVLRGGSYNLPATNCYVTARTCNEPTSLLDFAGFRVVLSQ